MPTNNSNISDAEMNPADVQIDGDFGAGDGATEVKTPPAEEPAPGEDNAPDAGQQETNEETGDEGKPKGKPTAQDRIRELNAEKRAERARAEAAEQRAADYERRMAALEAKMGLTTSPNAGNDTENTPAAPDPAKYEFGALDQRYIQDLTAYQAGLLVKQELASASRRQQEQAARAAEEQKLLQAQAKANEVIAKGEDLYDDFHEVVVKGAQTGKYDLTQPTFEALTEADNAAEIAYALAKDPTEARRVAALSPAAQAKWVFGKDAEIAARKAAKAPKAPPPPPNTPRGSSGRYSVAGDTDDLDAFSKAYFAR